MSDFKASYLGANYVNIDGTGWPDSVVMSNGGDDTTGTWETKLYAPRVLARAVPVRSRDFDTKGFMCSNCGYGVDKRNDTFCANCGAKL